MAPWGPIAASSRVDAALAAWRSAARLAARGADAVELVAQHGEGQRRRRPGCYSSGLRVLGQLRMVGIDANQLLVRGHADALEARAHGENDVGLVDRRLHPAMRPRGADEQRVALVDHAFAFTGVDDRGLEKFGDLDEGGAGSGEHRAAASDDHRVLRRGQQRGGFGDLRRDRARGRPAPTVDRQGGGEIRQRSGGNSRCTGRVRPRS